MRMITEIVDVGAAPQAEAGGTEVRPSAGRIAAETLTLTFDLRQRSRFRARLDCGEEVGVALPRGHVLRDGAILRDAHGCEILVRAAAEPVSQAQSDDPWLLARACYHLGNRHVPLQVERDYLRYAPDHVLDEMVLGLGLKVERRDEPFEPEAGAYGGHHHGHGHSHGD